MKPPPQTAPLDRTPPAQELARQGPLRLASDPCPLVVPTEAEAKTEYLSNARVIRILTHQQDHLRTLYPSLSALDAPAPAPDCSYSTGR